MVVRLWEDPEKDHEVVPVAGVGLLEEQVAAIAKVLGRKVLPVVLRHMLKPRVRMARVLEHRRIQVVEQRYVVVAGHRPQA